MRADPFVTIVPGEGFLGMVTVKTELGKIFLDVGMVQTRRYLRVDPRLGEEVASSGTRVMRCGCFLRGHMRRNCNSGKSTMLFCCDESVCRQISIDDILMDG